MDGFEKIGYALLAGVALVWLIGIVVGAIVAFPLGIIGLVAIVAIGVLLIKVIKERVGNKEDNYYSQNVDR